MYQTRTNWLAYENTILFFIISRKLLWLGMYLIIKHKLLDNERNSIPTHLLEKDQYKEGSTCLWYFINHTLCRSNHSQCVTMDGLIYSRLNFYDLMTAKKIFRVII